MTLTTKKTTTTKKTSKKPAPKTAHPWLKLYPSDIDWDIKITPKPLWELLDDTIKQIPHRPCVDFMGKKYTYGEIGDLVNRAAQGLQKMGVKKGTKVGIFMPNASYYVIMYFAIVKAGGIVVNYNPLYVDPEIKHQIADSETEIMVTLDLKLLYDKLVPQLTETSLKKLIVCSVAEALPFPKNYLFSLLKFKDKARVNYSDRIIPFSKLIDNPGKPKLHKVDPVKDVALLQYTGGTTGVPKGAMLSHANVYSNALQAAAWFVGTRFGEERILAGLPLFHVYAMTAVMNLAIRSGSEIIMMFPKFTAEDAMRLIYKHKVTFFPGVPTMYGMIAHHPKIAKADLSSLKACMSGGASLPRQIKEDFEGITGCKLVDAYGLSETSPAILSNPVYGLNKTGSIGIPFPGSFVHIVSLEDPTKQVPQGERGQIALKGPQVFLGYWKRPKDTEKSFANGYFLTGDVGYMDEDGYTFLVDRIKDLIICSGFNVYPRVVEEAIYKNPAVDEVTVIGVPDPKRGETVKAFIKLKPQEKLTVEELLKFLESRLSPIEMPKSVEFRDQLPKTMIGKLSKKELREGR